MVGVWLYISLNINHLLTAVNSLLARDSSSFVSAAHCFSMRLSLFCDIRFSLQINCMWTIIFTYYMASSVSGQDELNHALWLAAQLGKMAPPCPLGTTRCIPLAKFHQKPYNKSFVDQVCSVKMADIGLVLFLRPHATNYTQKKNLANIQPYWSHTCSITHTRTYVWRYFIKTLKSTFKSFKYFHLHTVTGLNALCDWYIPKPKLVCVMKSTWWNYKILLTVYREFLKNK